MYPGPKLLQEVGRVAIAAARLDMAMGQLWVQLDPEQDTLKARKAPSWRQREAVEALAEVRLEAGPLREEVRRVARAVSEAQDGRNAVIHQDWLLHGSEMVPSIPEPEGDRAEEWAACFDECEREAKESERWQGLAARSLDIRPAQRLEEIRTVERRLAALRWDVIALTGKVASARLIGKPRGYLPNSTR